MNNGQTLATIPIVASNGNRNATGTASEFTVPLSAPIRFGPKEVWSCALVDVSFPKSTSGNSVYVYLDILSRQEVGGGLFPLLWRTPPVTSTDNPQYFKESGTVIPWKHINRQVFDRLKFSIFESDGTPVPSGAMDFSTVSILLRREQ